MIISAGRDPIGIVGAGRVGAVLGAALGAAGHPVVAVSALSAASRDRAAALLPGVPVSTDPGEVARAAGLLLLAVPDDVLEGLVAGLAETGALRPGQLVVHTSGRHGLAVLAPAVAIRVRPLALHPAMTFAGTPDDLARLPGVRIGVTAPAELLGLARGLVADLGGVPVQIAEEARPAYHAALAHGANHLVTLVAQAADVLRGAGVAEPMPVLAPLLRAALEGALSEGDAATTGPVVRGDDGTVATHLAALADAPATVAAYRALAADTATRAVRRGRLLPHDAARVLEAVDPSALRA